MIEIPKIPIGVYLHFPYCKNICSYCDFVVDKNKHKDELDIKKGGIFPIVHGVRSLAIEKQIKESSTFVRLKALHNIGLIDEEFKNELTESFNFLLALR